MKRTIYLVFLILFLGLFSCNDKTITGEAKEQLTIEGINDETNIEVEEVLQLRAILNDTTVFDVIWVSSNPNIASVSEAGLVRGIEEGKVTISASLKTDNEIVGSYDLDVKAGIAPIALEMEGINEEEVYFTNSSANINVIAEPSSASNMVDFQSSDSSKALINEYGYLSFLKEGEVTITAVSKIDTSVLTSIDIQIKKGTFLVNKGSSLFDYSHQGDTPGFIDLNDEDDSLSKGFNSAYFAGISSTKFYAEATFRVKKLTSNTWDWQGFGLGSGRSDNDSRFFTFSPWCPKTTVNSMNKIILRDTFASWGALTDRSQVWGEHGLNNIDLYSDIKIAILRDNNDYYYLINDILYWFDINERYDGVNTSPYVVSFDIPLTISKYYATADESIIGEKLTSKEFTKTFFASNPFVDYVSDKDINFESINEINKENKVRSLGDKAKLTGSFVVDFDFEYLRTNSQKDCFCGLTINFSRYANANTVETFAVGKNPNSEALVGRYLMWNHSFSMEDKNSFYIERFSQEIALEEKQTHHLRISREIDEVTSKACFFFYLDGKEINFLTDSNEITEDSLNSEYLGAYLIWIGGEYSSVHITNFSIDNVS